MSQENKISAVITQQQKEAVNTALTSVNTNLKDVLIFNLSAQDRLEIAKMGDKTLAFVDKALQYAAQQPSLVPQFLDVVEANKDFQLAKDLTGILQQLNTLSRAVEDALMVAGGEAYDASLIFYNAVKGASRSNLPGSQAIADDLKQQFPRTVKAAVPANTKG